MTVGAVEQDAKDMQEARGSNLCTEGSFCRNTENAVNINNSPRFTASNTKRCNNYVVKIFSPHFLRKFTAKPRPRKHVSIFSHINTHKPSREFTRTNRPNFICSHTGASPCLHKLLYTLKQSYIYFSYHFKVRKHTHSYSDCQKTRTL